MTDLTQQDSKQYGRPDNLKIIPFMKIAKPAAIFSILLTIASIFFIVTKGLNLGLDFTGGKDDGQNGGMNLEGQPYQQWTGPQHFFNSVLTNQMTSNASGLTFSLNLPTGADYGYFAHPSSLGTATHIDQSTMWPGGWDGATWETDGNFGETAGPIEVTIDDGSGPRLWKIYRTDFSGIGQYTWAVNYS